MTRKRIVVTGGSGLIGSALVSSLQARGDDVVVVRRGEGSVTWDPDAGVLDPGILAGADAVVCLNGVGVGDKRWSDARKELIVTSRVNPTNLLARTMAELDDKPGAFIVGTAVGYYGDTGDTIATEASPAGSDFLADVVVAWEQAASPAIEAGIRTAFARTGTIVLSTENPAMKQLLPLFKAGLGGPIGDGRHWWSTITLRDEVRALEYLIDGELDGPVNLVGPNPVRQGDFAKALGAELGRPAVVPVPKFALDIRLGKEMAQAIGYGSQRVVPEVLLESGFQFTSSSVEDALREMLA
ncbi:MAG: TIGR01777 family oxidoreductase [Acidimicrobiia bacterium]|nr:TIGR01777 family oxidoreductase [Acidimicrobiia bacterium]